MELLSLLMHRDIIIGLAIFGALIATLGSILSRSGSWIRPSTARIVTRTGYGLSWISVIGFIVAGLLL